MTRDLDRYETYRSDGFQYANDELSMINSGSMNRDGRYPWRCEQCKKFQHPDHEMTRSIYYQFSGREGPFFCGQHCLIDYRDQNDMYRFIDEAKETNARKKGINKQWKVVKTTTKSLLESGTQKQQENVLNALHVATLMQSENEE